MLEKVRKALRLTNTFYDSELTDLIEAAKLDLGIAGVVVPVVTTETDTDKLIVQAIITYCKLNFGEPDNYDKLKESYDLQKAQLSMATGYTVWIDQT